MKPFFLIVGAGPAGIGMGILLKQLGIKNFRILFTLFIVGALHTRIWNQQTLLHTALIRPHRTFIQMPTWSGSGVSYRVRSTVFQFLTQVMPIFLVICLIAGLMDVLE
jgi:ferrous iron transport protein B